jgi:nitrite reductase (NADH) small subunit
MSEWIEVGKIEDIPRLGARVVESAQGDIAVFKTAKDEVFALLDACPHKAGPLSQGIVHGTSVTCPLHNWVLGLEDGQAKGPDEGCTNVYPVKIEADTVFLKI